MEKITCPKCGVQVDEDYSYCPSCGYELKKAKKESKATNTFDRVKQVNDVNPLRDIKPIEGVKPIELAKPVDRIEVTAKKELVKEEPIKEELVKEEQPVEVEENSEETSDFDDDPFAKYDQIESCDFVETNDKKDSSTFTITESNIKESVNADWTQKWYDKFRAYKKGMTIFFFVSLGFLIMFALLYKYDKEYVTYTYSYLHGESGYYVSRAGYMCMVAIFTQAAIFSFIFMISAFFCGGITVKNISGYKILVYRGGTVRLVIDGVERFCRRYGSRCNRSCYNTNYGLRCNLPNGDTVIATFYSLGREADIEVLKKK